MYVSLVGSREEGGGGSGREQPAVNFPSFPLEEAKARGIRQIHDSPGILNVCQVPALCSHYSSGLVPSVEECSLLECLCWGCVAGVGGGGVAEVAGRLMLAGRRVFTPRVQPSLGVTGDGPK